MEIELAASYPSLRGRVAVVTGGASGTGEAIVEAFVMQNAQVAFLDIQDTAAKLLIRKMEPARLMPPAYFHCDLKDVDAIRSTVRQIRPMASNGSWLVS